MKKAQPERPQTSICDLLKRRNFRLFWIGQGISLLGDHCYLIALPWLVLRLTGDKLAMGMVLGIGGVPRALLMLLGGAVTDRFSPREVMLVSDVLRLVVVALLALLVITTAVQLWMLYLFALLFGVADAFFFPAVGAIVGHAVWLNNSAESRRVAIVIAQEPP